MIPNKRNSDNKDALQKFAVRSSNKPKIYGDRAVTWSRSSSEKQSYEWQEKVTSDFVKQNNWSLIRAFGVKESAKTNDGAEFKEMLNYCYREKISHIVFFSYDRFNRSGDISILKNLRKKGIKVHAATQGVDDETPSGRMTQQMYMMFAEMENEQRREKIIEGIKNKLRKGEWPTQPTIGYEKRFVTGKKEHEHDKKQCFINKDGELLRQAFQWKYNENMPNLKVQERLKSIGMDLPLPQLTRIFRNPFYCGYITHKLLDEGEIIKGKHEPLVSEEIFLHVNGVGHKKPNGWNVIREHDEMPLKATFKCNKCNRPLTAYVKKEKYVYYKCPNNGCYVNISQSKLHSLFVAELSKFSFNYVLIPAIKSQLEAAYWTIHRSDNTREKPMKDELARLKKELEAMELNVAIGSVSPEIFAKHSAAHEQKINAIESGLKTLVHDSSNLSNYISSAVENSGNLVHLWQNLNYHGKVRLQKLVYPDGLMYMPEIHAVRTLMVNPIFSAITSISQILDTKVSSAVVPESDKFHSVYLMFGSSNFLLGNLEKIANELKTLVLGDSYYTSFSGDARCNFISNSTLYHQSIERTFLNIPLMNETGATTKHRK